MVLTFMALKKLTFELARTSGWNYCIPFLAKGARNKTCSFISNIDILTIYGPILTIPFSVGPYRYYQRSQICMVCSCDAREWLLAI